MVAVRRRAAVRRRVPRRERRRAGRALHARGLRAAPRWPRSGSRRARRHRAVRAALRRLHVVGRRARHLALLAVQIVLAALLGDRTRTAGSSRERARLRRPSATAGRRAAAERARIARELHDVVAHSLSVVIAQADGGRYAAERDPAAGDGRAAHDRRAPPARRWARCAARSAPARADGPRFAPARRRATSPRSSTARARPAWRSSSTSEGAARALAPAAGLAALPRRPGGAHERAQARRAGRAPRTLELRWEPDARRRSWSATTAPARRGRPTAAARGLAGHARARRAARRHAQRRPAPRRRLRGARRRSRMPDARDPRLPRRRPGARARRASARDRLAARHGGRGGGRRRSRGARGARASRPPTSC